MAKLLPVLVAILAVLAGIYWQLETHFAHPTQPSYETAGTATNQLMLKNLGKALDSQFDFLPKALAGLASWLTRPPGARFSFDKPDKTDGSTPTIKMLKVCKLVCKVTDFPVVVNPKCVACLTLTALPTWAHGEGGKPNPPLARLPLYESGMTSVAAIPLLYPRRWATADLLQGFGLTDYAATAEAQTLANDNWQGGVNPTDAAWTIGGVKRPVVSKMRAAVPPVCVEELGWITPAGAPACPGGANLTDVDVPFPNIDAVGGQALPLAYGSAESYRAVSLELTREAFASAQEATDATIDTMQTSYSTTLFMKNVTSKKRLRQLAELYGADEWEPLGAEAIAAAGDLIEVDLMYLQAVVSTAPPAHEGDGPWWNVAAHALFRVVDGGGRKLDLPHHDSSPDQPFVPIFKHSVSFKPVAILLSNQPSNPGAKLVYTPEKSESAYILAAMAVRQAAIQTAIWVGHVYNLHIQSAAATVALYNTIDPQKNVYYSTHPVRQILDFFADPTYVSEFHSSLFATGYAAGPGTSAGVPDLLSLWNAYTKKGIAHSDTSWFGSTMHEQLKSSGLSEKRFRGDGEEGSFEALPGVAMNLAIRRTVAAPYAKAVIDAAYPSDKAVADDQEVQAFAAALVSPHGSNLGRINEANQLKTKAQLSKFVEDYVTIVLTHGSAHLQDYSMRVLNVALNPPRLGRQTAPNPEKQYSPREFMEWMPTTGSAARQYTFVANFVGTTMLPVTNLVASQQFLKGAAPTYSDGTPYYTGANADDFEAAHQVFIRKASALLREWPRSHGLRAVATNFQDPTRLPRVINI